MGVSSRCYMSWMLALLLRPAGSRIGVAQLSATGAHACDSSVEEGGLQKRGEEWAVPAPGLLRKLLAAKAGLLLQVLVYHVFTRILLSTGAVWVLL